MTSPSMPWIKLHTTRLNDPRLGQLDDGQKWRYIALYLLAARLDAGGAFIQDGRELTPDEIAFYLRSDAATIKADLRTLKAAALASKNGYGWELTDFQNEQGPGQAEKRKRWRERQARLRDAKRKQADVTKDKQRVTREKVTRKSRKTNEPVTKEATKTS